MFKGFTLVYGALEFSWLTNLGLYRDLDRLEDEATPQFTPLATSEHISSLLYLSSLFEATKIPPLKVEAF